MNKRMNFLIAALAALALISSCVQNYAGYQKEMPAPPDLLLFYATEDGANEECSVSPGPYQWEHRDAAGFAQQEIACGPHPLDNPETLPALTKKKEAVSFSFAQPPAEVSLRCWPAHYAGRPEIYDAYSVTIPVEKGQFMLPENNQSYICELSGAWTQGNASYVFRVQYAKSSNAPS